MDRRKIVLRNTIQRELKIQPISEALPVMIIIGRLLSIAVMILAAKMLHERTYLIYLDDILELKKEYLHRKYVLRILFIDIPATTFIYNFIVAGIFYETIKKYNSLLEGTIKSLEALGKLIDYKLENLEELRKYKVPKIWVILLAYNAFLRFLFIAPALIYLDYKTSKGCRKVAARFYEGGTAAMDRGLPVLMPPELINMATPIKREGGPQEVRMLNINRGSLAVTLLANVVLSIPAAIWMHKIIRRVNTTIRVCRRMTDTLASTITIS